MTTAQAARSATPNGASAAAVAVLKVVRREEAVQEEAHREARLRGIQAEVAVVPAAMTMIIMPRAAVVVEAAGDSSLSQNRQNYQNLIINVGRQRLATACRCYPTYVGIIHNML